MAFGVRQALVMVVGLMLHTVARLAAWIGAHGAYDYRNIHMVDVRHIHMSHQLSL
jgi:hypothetical protein